MRLPVDRRDLLAGALVAAAYGTALLLMPARRDFVYVDDWVFTRAAEGILHGGGFVPSEVGQQTLATHAYWGALFGWLLGMNLTTPVLANMMMSLIAALAFYALLRRAGLAPGLSSLGVALLLLNPFYLTLSYSFMTEITFTAMLLLSCLCYLEGLRGETAGWLWWGGLFAALAFLTRQFGLAAPAAACLWLLCARRLTWRRLAAVAILPLGATLGYFVWSSGFAPTFSGSVARQDVLGLFSSPAAWVERIKSLHFALPQLGLSMPLLARLRHWKPAAVLALASAGLVYVQGARRAADPLLNPHLAAPFDTAQPFRLEFTALWWLGAALTVWLLFALGERAWPRLRELWRRHPPRPVEFLYLTGLVLLVGTVLARTEFYTRYMLPIVPFGIVAGLLWLQSVPPAAPGRRAAWVGLLVVLAGSGLAAIALHLDDYAFLSVRWGAGHTLVAQGVPYTRINNGFPWDAYYLYDAALRQTNIHDLARLGSLTVPEMIIDPEYVIGINRVPGYHVARTYRYFSLLDGPTTHDLYVLQRDPPAASSLQPRYLGFMLR